VSSARTMIKMRVLKEAVAKANRNQNLFEFSFDGDLTYDNNAYGLIFDRHFAQALWGEKEQEAPRYIKEREFFKLPATGDKVHEVNLDKVRYDLTPGGWKYHLQQMVIVNDPILYLGKHLNDVTPEERV
jgi:hypothetical protein